MNLQEKHYVGVDCHKDTIACYINGKFKEFRTDFKGFLNAKSAILKAFPTCGSNFSSITFELHFDYIFCIFLQS